MGEKRSTLLWVLAILALASACTGGRSSVAATIVPTEATPTVSPVPAATETAAPVSTATIAPEQGGSLPANSPAIDPQNVSKLTALKAFVPLPPVNSLIKATADGKLYFVASQQGLDSYDTQSGRLIRHYDIPVRVPGQHGSSPTDLQLSGDGSRFLGAKPASGLSVYDSAEGKEIYSFNLPLGMDVAGSLALSPDGKQLALDLCSDCRAYKGTPDFKVIRVDDGTVLYDQAAQKGLLHGSHPVYSPDGNLLITQSGSQIIVWDTATWSRISVLPSTSGTTAQAIAFSRDSRLVAIGGGGKVVIWRVANPQRVQSLDVCRNTSAPLDARFLSDSTHIVTLGCGRITVWSVDDGSRAAERPFDLYLLDGVEIEPDGKITQYQPEETSGANRLPWSRANFGVSTLAATGSPADWQLTVIGRGYPGSVCSIASWTQVQCEDAYSLLGADGQLYRYTSPSFTPFQLYQGTGTDGGPILTLSWIGYMIEPISFDPQHGLLFYNVWSDPSNATAHIFDLTNKRKADWSGSYFQGELAYSPDGNLAAFYLKRFLYSGGSTLNSRLILYDLTRRLEVYEVDSSRLTHGIAFSPDGNSLATTLSTYKDKSGSQLYIMDPYHPGLLEATRYDYPDIVDGSDAILQYSPDGTFLSAFYPRSVVRLYSARDGTLLHEWQAGSGGNYDRIVGSFSPDMKYLITASGGATIRVWGIPPE